MEPSKKKTERTRYSFDVLVTAGPTRENIDPVRYISNTSSGKMGYCVTERLLEMGFTVCLVTGPSSLPAPDRADVVRVYTAEEMSRAVKERVRSCRAVVMSAAVCDLRPERVSTKKIKKKDKMSVTFVKTPDILREIGERPGLVKVGFALETEAPIHNGRKKLKEKKLDMIVVNTIKKGSDPFGDSKCDYVLMYKRGGKKKVLSAGKESISEIIAGESAKLIRENNDDEAEKK